jgi:hypothetical protein
MTFLIDEKLILEDWVFFFLAKALFVYFKRCKQTEYRSMVMVIAEKQQKQEKTPVFTRA